ncbi:hypothetical protein HMPREF2534_00500 [Bacteroides thetaiotaomicron]|nr:hypothetical protein HMPREF2534_00500 [Bacteroides thetaiotaomicron]
MSRQRQKIHNEKLVVVILFYISYVVNGTKVAERRKKNGNLISEAEKEKMKRKKKR